MRLLLIALLSLVGCSFMIDVTIPEHDAGDGDLDGDVDGDGDEEGDAAVDGDADVDGDVETDGDVAVECDAPEDPRCDDGNPCTIDSCVAGECGYEYASEGTDCEGTFYCREGETCDGEGYCDAQSGAPFCDDGIGCTVDICVEEGGACSSLPDHGECPEEMCLPDDLEADALTGCAPRTACPGGEDIECDDGQFCNGAETCNGTDYFCEPGELPFCGDEASCTHDSCDPAAMEGAGACVFQRIDTSCEDFITCTTNFCDPSDEDADDETGCVMLPDNVSCSDDVSCTSDETCDPEDGSADEVTGCIVTLDDAVCEGVAEAINCIMEAVCDPFAAEADAESGCVATAVNEAVCDGIASSFTCVISAECDPWAAGADSASGCVAFMSDAICREEGDCYIETCSPWLAEADEVTGCFVREVECADDDGCCPTDCAPADNDCG